MPSKKANRYGTLAERHAAEKYNLRREGEHTSWCDAIRETDGVPVEIKSAMVSTGYFQIYRKYHEKLREVGGRYVFVVYRVHGRGIRVLKTRMKRSEHLSIRSRWSPTGGHRDSEKAKVEIRTVMDD